MTDLPEDSRELRDAVIATARAMNASGINVNKSGNVSVRCRRGTRSGYLLTPTGVPYERLEADDIAFVDAEGRATGRCAPSSEWRFHSAIYAGRADLHAVVHSHSPHATALACQGLSIPAFHYMVATAGGHDIRCGSYATFGTQAVASLLAGASIHGLGWATLNLASVPLLLAALVAIAWWRWRSSATPATG